MQLPNFSPEATEREWIETRRWGWRRVLFKVVPSDEALVHDSTCFTLNQIRVALFSGHEAQKFHAALQEPVSQEFAQWGDNMEKWGEGRGIKTDSGWRGDDLVSEFGAEAGGNADTFQGWRLMAEKTWESMQIERNRMTVEKSRGGKVASSKRT